MSATVVHVPGPAQFGGLYQVCRRCGYVLQDLTASQPMVVEGEDTSIASWPVGKRVAISGNATWTLQDDVPLESGENECRYMS